MRNPTLAALPLCKLCKTGWPWTEESPQLPDKMDDGSPWPRISIVTPSYNQAEFIEETIRSVLLQGYPDMEYIIIDGGSTDGSIEIIKKYEPWLTYWISEQDRGQSHAINKGFKKASAQIYAFINSDDYYLPGALGSVAKNFNSNVGLWVGTTLQVGVDGVLRGERIAPSLDFDDVADWQKNWFRQPGCFFSNSVFEKVGGINEQLEYALDFDLWLSILLETNAKLIDDRLAVARNHPMMKTQNKGGRGFAEDQIVQIRHGMEHLAIREIDHLYQQVKSYENQFRLFISMTKFVRRSKDFILNKMRVKGWK
jgi:glycosyltransferase involved in cell wall biosynthesis